MSKHTTRHYCRNTHCRAKLAAPVDNEHHAFCTSGCHAIFYRHRCLVCENRCAASPSVSASVAAIRSARTNISVFRTFRLSRRKSSLPYVGCATAAGNP